MRDRWGRGCRRLAAGALAGVLAGAAAEAAEPTAQEQLFVYEVNRARHDPPAWAAELGLDGQIGGDGNLTTLSDVEPRPPLALNPLLVDSSRFKAEEMADNDYFAHQSAVTDIWPNGLVRSFGYPLAQQVPRSGGGFWTLPDDSNQVEALACGFGSGPNDFSQALNALIALIVDAGVPSLGHRTHLLGMTDLSAAFVEAGAGYGFNGSASCRNYWAFHTGVKQTPETFLTGVVYADTNANQLYDPGEGLAGVTVTVDGSGQASTASGGWSLQVDPGSHQVVCSGGSFAGTGTAQVTVGDENRQVDCISGFEGAQVDFVPVPEPGRWPAQLAAVASVLLVSGAWRRT